MRRRRGRGQEEKDEGVGRGGEEGGRKRCMQALLILLSHFIAKS